MKECSNTIEQSLCEYPIEMVIEAVKVAKDSKMLNFSNLIEKSKTNFKITSKLKQKQ
jgi:hypothetical protein